MTDLAPSETQQLTLLFEKQKKRSIVLRSEPLKERKRRLKKFAEYLLTQREAIAEAVFADFKKPKSESDLSELYPVLTEIRHTIAHLHEWAAPQKIDSSLTYLGTRSQVRLEPKGVCLIIAPWNFPVNLSLGPLVSCLAAGNTAIIKPSEMTPHTARALAAMINNFFEEDRVAVVEGDQHVAEQLLALPFDHIFFTGSPAVGKLIMKAAAENLSSVTLELGGKSPVVLDASADIEDAAKRIAFGKFLNNGQTCIAPDYALIEEPVQEKFIQALKNEIVKIFGQDGAVNEQTPHYGRIVNRKHFDRINRMVSDAITHGAKIELSGEMNSHTNFIPPTIMSQVSPDSQIMQEEIFGPILPVVSFKTIDQAIDFINDRPKPLALYIFSGQKKNKEKILTETSAGSVCVNDCVLQFTHPGLPFGGVNNSGIGKAHGRYGFLSFSNEKPVLKQKNGFAIFYLLHPSYFKFRKQLIDLMVRWF